MTIIVETGAQVTNSNSYSDRADYIAHAAAIGITIADDTDADEQLIQAARFIDSLEAKLKGWRVSRDQSMAYPRHEVWIDDYAWDSDEIPRQVILAQMSLALDINAGEDLYNPSQSAAQGVKRERVEGAVEVEYATGTQQPLTRRSRSQALLSALMHNGGLMSIKVTMG